MSKNKDFTRTDRVADAIKRELSQLVQHEMNDPRVGLVNVNGVSVTRDLAFAKVYVTFVGGQGIESSNVHAGGDNKTSIVVLNKAAGFLRTLLAKTLNMRTTPRLQFIYDHTPVYGQQLSQLIDRAIAQDQVLQSADSTGQREEQ